MKAAIDRPLPSYPAALAGTGRPALWLPLLLLPTLWASPAAASPAGPSSSATVRIILSVASRLELKPLGRPDGPNSADYCISGNIGRTSLPIRLLWLAPGSAAADAGKFAVARQGTEMSWCGGEETRDGLPAVRERTGLALISPE
jgi:hypothetical protein